MDLMSCAEIEFIEKTVARINKITCFIKVLTSIYLLSKLCAFAAKRQF